MILQELTITDLTPKGFGVSFYNGKKVFIDETLKDEVILCEIADEHPTYYNGKIKKILNPSQHRTTGSCSIQGCGGCQFLHCSYSQQLALKNETLANCFKSKALMNNIYTIPNCIGADCITGYRNKSIYYVRHTANGNAIGLFRKNSHDIVPVQECLMDPKWTSDANQIILSWMSNFKIDAYNEQLKEGLIKELIYRTGYKTEERMVIIVTTNLELPHQKELIDSLKELQVVSIYINSNKTVGNGVYGDKFKLIYGKEKIETYLDGLKFNLGPRAFWQINSKQCEKLYSKVAEFADLSKNQNVFDLYCGAGSISLYLARQAKYVYGVEIVEDAILDARKNAQLNNICNAEFVAGNSENLYQTLVEQHGIPDIVVVDPPRKGCDAKLLYELIEKGPNKIVYVSCLPDSLARDLKILTQRKYQVDKICTVDMFPNTLHVETVVLLSRAK